MAASSDFDDIPGTILFDGKRARQGYPLNAFCMSLMHEENRRAFKADEKVYLQRFAMSAVQCDAVLARDWNGMLALGGNIYYLAKLGATDGKSFQFLAAAMTGMDQEQYARMMLGGGRSIEGHRSLRERSRG